MNWKTFAFLGFVSVLGIILSSFFVGNVMMNQVIKPFGTLNPITSNPESYTAIDIEDENKVVQFVDADFLTGWIPWVIQQVSILVGGLSLIIFFYAGVNLIVRGNNEEELKKSSMMILYGIVGIGLAALSYSIVANVLVIF